MQTTLNQKGLSFVGPSNPSSPQKQTEINNFTMTYSNSRLAMKMFDGRSPAQATDKAQSLKKQAVGWSPAEQAQWSVGQGKERQTDSGHR